MRSGAGGGGVLLLLLGLVAACLGLTQGYRFHTQLDSVRVIRTRQLFAQSRTWLGAGADGSALGGDVLPLLSTSSAEPLPSEHSVDQLQSPLSTSGMQPPAVVNMQSTEILIKKPLQPTLPRLKTALVLAALAAIWVMLPTPIFALGFAAICWIAMSEYLAIFSKIDVVPAARTTRLLSGLFFASALLFPKLTSPLLSASLLFVFAAHLSSNSRPVGAFDLLSSVFACLYLGYFPSYWIRLHSVVSPWFVVQLGKILTVWTFATIISVDVAGYFVGRAIGKHKLSSLSFAAGQVSPNKSVEGLLGGLIAAMLVGLLGAKMLRIPNGVAFGCAYGLSLFVSSVLGDLLASALKRSAQVKDSGTLLPGHGGMLDRLDSHLLTGAVAFHVLSIFGLIATR